MSEDGSQLKREDNQIPTIELPRDGTVHEFGQTGARGFYIASSPGNRPAEIEVIFLCHKFFDVDWESDDSLQRRDGTRFWTETFYDYVSANEKLPGDWDKIVEARYLGDPIEDHAKMALAILHSKRTWQSVIARLGDQWCLGTLDYTRSDGKQDLKIVLPGEARDLQKRMEEIKSSAREID